MSHSFFIIGLLQFSGCPLCHFSRLQKVQNSAAKWVFKACKCDHAQLHLQALHWLPAHTSTTKRQKNGLVQTLKFVFSLNNDQYKWEQNFDYSISIINSKYTSTWLKHLQYNALNKPAQQVGYHSSKYRYILQYNALINLPNKSVTTLQSTDSQSICRTMCKINLPYK